MATAILNSTQPNPTQPSIFREHNLRHNPWHEHASDRWRNGRDEWNRRQEREREEMDPRTHHEWMRVSWRCKCRSWGDVDASTIRCENETMLLAISHTLLLRTVPPRVPCAPARHLDSFRCSHCISILCNRRREPLPNDPTRTLRGHRPTSIHPFIHFASCSRLLPIIQYTCLAFFVPPTPSNATLASHSFAEDDSLSNIGPSTRSPFPSTPSSTLFP